MSSTVELEKVLSTGEIARALRITTEKVCRWIRSGELLATDLSQDRGERPRYAILPSDLQAFLDSRMVVKHVQTQIKKGKKNVKRYYNE